MRKKIYIRLLASALAGVCILSGCEKKQIEEQKTTVSAETVMETTTMVTELAPMPWDEPGAKQPMDYTWEEFQALDGIQQFMFQKSFLEPEAFEMWYDRAQQAKKAYPWETPDAKQPAEYSWEEFETLTGEEQIAFQKTFKSQEEFEEWMKHNMASSDKEDSSDEKKYPWEEPKAKKPGAYTWEEFEALTGEEQIAFQKTFWSIAAFEAWATKANPEAQTEEMEESWKETNGKQPREYSWEDFLQLTAEEQMKFQNSFKSDAEFEKWMDAAMSEGIEDPWTAKDGKRPEDYSWEEFEALKPDQQMRFQCAFSQKDGFLTWYEQNKPV